MAKEEWGVKRVCPTTGKRFYDLNKTPIVSPYTGEVVEVETGKRSMIAADAEDAASKKAKKDNTEDSDIIEEDDVEVDLVAGAARLGGGGVEEGRVQERAVGGQEEKGHHLGRRRPVELHVGRVCVCVCARAACVRAYIYIHGI